MKHKQGLVWDGVRCGAGVANGGLGTSGFVYHTNRGPCGRHSDTLPTLETWDGIVPRGPGGVCRRRRGEGWGREATWSSAIHGPTRHGEKK